MFYVVLLLPCITLYRSRVNKDHSNSTYLNIFNKLDANSSRNIPKLRYCRFVLQTAGPANQGAVVDLQTGPVLIILSVKIVF